MATPIIFLATVLLLFLALQAYFHALVYQTVGVAAERTAYAWDNSRKDPVTGAVGMAQNDGLYWRLTDDHLSGIFGFITGNSEVKVSLPASEAPALTESSSSPAEKLERAASQLNAVIQGEMGFTNTGVLRKVTLDAYRLLSIPFGFGGRQGLGRMDANAASYIIDPVETIRLTELAVTFVSEVKGLISPSAAASLLKDPLEAANPKAVIASHAQAAAYLRTLVSGKETIVQVDEDTKRVIDALDSSGIAHQAYYTFDEKNLREVQMPKDAELLKQGTQIKGVVWHFFKLSKQDRVKLTQTLKSELEQRGIVVIFHE